MEMKLPVDFERLTETRALQMLIGERATKESNLAALADVVSVYIVAKLFVDLAYQAQINNRPGYLQVASAKLFVSGLEHPTVQLPVMELLVESGWLTFQVEPTSFMTKELQITEYFCERFARLNGHLAGNFKSKEAKGAAQSEVARSQRRIAQEALQQGMLLPSEIYRRRDGKPIEGSDIQRVLVLIKTLDNMLKVSGRRTGQFTEGLIADAAAAIDAKTTEELREFYGWLILHRDNAMVPKTTEQVLAKFEEIFAMQG